MTDREYSVAAFYSDDTHAYIARWLDAERACNVFAGCIAIADMAGAAAIDRIIITDGGDHTVAQWEAGKGITWPEGVACRVTH